MTIAARPHITELDFQRQLVGTKPPGLAVIYGWEHVHFRPAMTKHGYRTAGSGSMGAGWPDLVLVRVRDRRLIFAELKRDGGSLSGDQKRVLAVLAALDKPASTFGGATSVEVYVWRPRDLPEIAEILR